jgi:aspartyl-tRNA(Asn)/glutamyl-tRNA(Gln) amidotransferase subunit C
MSVDKSTVVRIASLARIRVPEAELDGLAEELSNILGWVEQLDQVDTEGVSPMASAAEGMGLRWRKDTVTDGDCRDSVLANAPEARDGFFMVPKVIE